MALKLHSAPFDPWANLQQFQQQIPSGSFGATATFVGTMRDFNEGSGVQSMILEHYPGMTEKELEKIIAEAEAKWSLQEVLVEHRVGEVKPGDPIVLVAVWSAHRREAFEACRALMEALKSRAPFWKRERLDDEAERWIEKNSSGY